MQSWNSVFRCILQNQEKSSQGDPHILVFTAVCVQQLRCESSQCPGDAQTTKMWSIHTVSCHAALEGTGDILRCADTSVGPKNTVTEGQTPSLLTRVQMESNCRQEPEWWVLRAQAGPGGAKSGHRWLNCVPKTTEVVHLVLCTSKAERVLGGNSEEKGRGERHFQRNKLDRCSQQRKSRNQRAVSECHHSSAEKKNYQLRILCLWQPSEHQGKPEESSNKVWENVQPKHMNQQ